MKVNKIVKACLSLLKIGCIGFGGGNALIPIIQAEIVEKEKLITQEEYEEDIVVASVTPGALPVELSAGIGKRIARRKGMLLGATCMAFPGAVLTIVLLIFLSNVSNTFYKYVYLLTTGIVAYIVTMLTSYIEGSIVIAKREGLKSLFLSIIVIVAVFIATGGKSIFRLFGINNVSMISLSTINVFILAFFVILFTNGKNNIKKIIVAFCVCIAYVCTIGVPPLIEAKLISWMVRIIMIVLAGFGLCSGIICQDKVNIQLSFSKIIGDIVMVSVGLGILAIITGLVMPGGALFIWKGVISSIMSFGGGDAFLTVADGVFVEGNVISEDAFYSQLVPLVNIIPGSILCKTVTGVGYLTCETVTGSLFKSIVVALTGFLGSVFVNCGIFSTVSNIYCSLQNMYFFQTIRRWIRSIVSGLMLTVITSLLYQCVKNGKNFECGYEILMLMVCIYFIETLLTKRKVSNSVKIAVAIVVSCGMGWMIYLV